MTDDIEIKKAAQRYNANKRNKQNQFSMGTPDDEGNYLTGFGQSAASSMLETFGAKPLKGAPEFRAENPVGGFVSETLGVGIPYFGAYKASQGIRKLDDFAKKQGEKGSNAFTKGARDMGTRMAPFEAARLASDIAVSPEDAASDVVESLFNLTLEAGAGGIAGALGSGGKVVTEVPDVGFNESMRAAKQMKLRRFKEKTADLDEVPDDIQHQIKKLEDDIRMETAGRPGPKIEFDDGDARPIRRLFSDPQPKQKGIVKSRLANTTTDFPTNDITRRKEVMKMAGMDDNLDAAQLPRHVSFGAKKNASELQNQLFKQSKMGKVDNNTLMKKDTDGMYVMARKIVGDMQAAKETDEWVVWRTDQPGRFSPKVKEYTDRINASMAYLREDPVKINPDEPATLMDSLRGTVQQMPPREFRGAVEKVGLGKATADTISKSLGFPEGSIGSSFAAQRGKAFVKKYLTPALDENRNDPHSAYIMAMARRAFDHSRKLSTKILKGDAVDEGTKGFSKIFFDPKHNGRFGDQRAVEDIIESLDQDDLDNLYKMSDALAGAEDIPTAIDDLYRDGSISPALRDAFHDFNKLDEEIVNQLMRHQKQAGVQDFNPLSGHLMLSRVWEGDFRTPIVNDAGEIVYMASGKDPKTSDKLADQLLKEIGDEGSGLKTIPATKYDDLEDTALAERVNIKSREFNILSDANRKLKTNPQTFKKREGVGGFKTKYSKKELKDRISSHISERFDYMAGLSVENVLGENISLLKDLDPKAFDRVATRLRQMANKPGAVGTAINKETDRLLKPVLGRNSATKISAFTNEYMYHIQLGSANLAFPALNAVTFMQTVLPEAAFVMKASDSRVMRDYYEVYLAAGSDLKPRTNVGVLSPAKITAKSMGKLFKPDETLAKSLDRARHEGVIDPQMLNEFVGHTSEQATKISDVLNGEEPFINLVKTWSTMLPSKSERFARGHAFVVGDLLAKDVMGLVDEQAYQFAKKFTERTMFNYGTADRPVIMGGPLGRMFGLFKNWQTHYIFSMMKYADEGFTRGNWSPLMWQMGGTSAVGGVAALPLYSVADSFSKMASDESLMTNIYEGFGGTDPEDPQGGLADAIYLGLPAFLGVSMSGNATAPFNDPSRDAAQLMAFPQMDRMVKLGRAVGEAVEKYSVTGEHPMNSPDVARKFAAALAPKNIARSMQITKDHALQSLTTGNTVMKDLTFAERVLHVSGFTPKRIGVTYEAANELWKDQKARQKETQAYGKAWMEAQEEGNYDQLWQLQKEAAIKGLDISSITKSANTRARNRDEEQIKVKYKPEHYRKLQELGLIK